MPVGTIEGVQAVSDNYAGQLPGQMPLPESEGDSLTQSLAELIDGHPMARRSRDAEINDKDDTDEESQVSGKSQRSNTTSGFLVYQLEQALAIPTYDCDFLLPHLFLL